MSSSLKHENNNTTTSQSLLDQNHHLKQNEEEVEEEGDLQESFSYAAQLMCSTVSVMSLKTAVELRVFDIIATAGSGAKLSPAEIAAQLPTNNPDAPVMLDRILRLLASHSLLRCSVVTCDGTDGGSNCQRLYSLSRVSKLFVTDEDGVSFGPMVSLLQDKVFMESWYELKDAILEGGIAFNRVHGTNAFEYPRLDPRFNKLFNVAMYNQTRIIVKNILEFYKGFENIKQLVDVGGGLGVTLNLITSKYTHIKGINFDLPHVVKHAPSYPGVEHVGGDMFESVPSGDAIFMKWILHDWSDEYCLKLLKKCYKAIPDDGKVIVVDSVLPVKPETNSTAQGIFQGDVLMMTQNPGGKERSRQEFQVLATNAGFSGIKFECCVCGMWVMEFLK